MLNQLRREIESLLTEAAQLPAPLGEQISGQVIAALQHVCGGERVYIPKSDPVAAGVRADFNGTNRVEVCARYAISAATFYRIVGRKEKRRVRTGTDDVFKL
jgi:Mor family transcriptional regulator